MNMYSYYIAVYLQGVAYVKHCTSHCQTDHKVELVTPHGDGHLTFLQLMTGQVSSLNNLLKIQKNNLQGKF